MNIKEIEDQIIAKIDAGGEHSMKWFLFIGHTGEEINIGLFKCTDEEFEYTKKIVSSITDKKINYIRTNLKGPARDSF